LGDTIEEIAWQKAGILKVCVAVILDRLLDVPSSVYDTLLDVPTVALCIICYYR
jgi:folylpolyglutamate synthase/dihydropteroate synthase